MARVSNKYLCSEPVCEIFHLETKTKYQYFKPKNKSYPIFCQIRNATARKINVTLESFY